MSVQVFKYFMFRQQRDIKDTRHKKKRSFWCNVSVFLWTRSSFFSKKWQMFLIDMYCQISKSKASDIIQKLTFPE